MHAYLADGEAFCRHHLSNPTSIGLFDDLGNEIQVTFYRSCVLLEELVLVGFGDFIFAQPLVLIQRMRHRLHGARIGGLELGNEGDDVGQLGCQVVGLGWVDFQASELAKLLNFFWLERHGLKLVIEITLNYTRRLPIVLPVAKVLVWFQISHLGRQC